MSGTADLHAAFLDTGTQEQHGMTVCYSCAEDLFSREGTELPIGAYARSAND